MRSALYSSFVTSSSRRSQTSDLKWRRRRPPAERAETGSPASECVGNSPTAPERPPAPNRNPPSRTPASARRRRAAKTLTPPPLRGRGRSKMNSGRSSTSFKEKGANYATKPSCCEENWTGDIPRLAKTPTNLSRALCLMGVSSANASTRGGCGRRETSCCCGLRNWRPRSRRRRWRRLRSHRSRPRPARRRPALRWATWTRCSARPPGRRACPLLTLRDSRRFSSRAILSNSKDISSLLPSKLR